MLLQKFIGDSIGRSIRVLCFNNKAFSIIEFNSDSGDFRSNYFIGDEFARYNNLAFHDKADDYKAIAEKACRSIGDNLIIAGVDLIDSATDGILVIEINAWPELFETWETTGINTPKKFAETFVQKIERHVTAKVSQHQTDVDQQSVGDCSIHSQIDSIFKNMIITNPA
jgi:ribosomal protein S6--L-glutamate ligase